MKTLKVLIIKKVGVPLCSFAKCLKDKRSNHQNNRHESIFGADENLESFDYQKVGVPLCSFAKCLKGKRFNHQNNRP